jgi:hypothetical protein
MCHFCTNPSAVHDDHSRFAKPRQLCQLHALGDNRLSIRVCFAILYHKFVVAFIGKAIIIILFSISV